MSKKGNHGVRKKKISRSHKTAKRLEIKRAMLAARKPKRGSVRFRRGKY